MGVLQASLVLDFDGAEGGLAFHPVLQRHEFLAAHDLRRSIESSVECHFKLKEEELGIK